MKTVIKLSILAIAGLMLTACGAEEEEVQEQAIDSYQVKGVYVTKNEEDSYITVIHEEIPDVMNAMRMNINVENISVAEDLERGDVISFNLERDGFSWFARDIEVLPDDTDLDLPQNLLEMIENL